VRPFACVALLLFAAACGDAPPARVATPPIASVAPSAAAPASAVAAPAPPPALEPCNDEPTTASSAPKPELPALPDVPSLPERDGDAFTVHGAVRALHDRAAPGALGGEIAIVGFIVDSNFSRAPKCALHTTGKADPDHCNPDVPAFSIADAKGASGGERIAVLGWASNVANVFDASLRYKSGKRPAALWRDTILDIEVPFPIPAVGAKVRVRGRYGVAYTKSTSGRVADARNGVLTYAAMEYLTPSPPTAAAP
jgi:hypothetical protein